MAAVKKRSATKARRVPLDEIPALLEQAAGVMAAEVQRLSLRASGTAAEARGADAKPRLTEAASKTLARFMAALTSTYREHRAEEREIEARLKEKTLAELQELVRRDGALPAKRKGDEA